MRILFVCNSPGWGGAEHYLIRLAEGVKAEGHTALLATGPNSPLAVEARLAGLEVLPLELGPKLSRRSVGDFILRYPRYRRALRDLLSSVHGRIDVVHFQFKKEQILGTEMAGRWGLPVVWTEHGHLPGALARNPLAMNAYRRAAAGASAILAVSADVKRHLVECGVDPGALVVQHNGIPEPTPSKRARDEVRSEFRVSTDAPLIGAVARLTHEKGIDRLIRAAPTVVAKCPEVRFVIVGDGPERPLLEAEAGRLGVDAHFHFAGHRADVGELLPAFDLFVLPSLREGLPFAVLEAMSAGLPVVATRVGGVPEAVAEGVTGLVVPADAPDALADALVTLLRDSTRRLDMGRQGKARVSLEFSSQAMIQGTLEVLKGIPGAPWTDSTAVRGAGALR